MKEIIIKDKQKYLQEKYPFMVIPELSDRKHCIHCDRDIIVGNFKVYSDHGTELIYCPNAPDCDGTVIDWIDIK